jgi:hypothetical protein
MTNVVLVDDAQARISETTKLHPLVLLRRSDWSSGQPSSHLPVARCIRPKGDNRRGSDVGTGRMTKYLTPHACLVCPQTHKVFLRSARPTYVLHRYETWRPFEELEAATTPAASSPTRLPGSVVTQ